MNNLLIIRNRPINNSFNCVTAISEQIINKFQGFYELEKRAKCVQFINESQGSY